MDYHHEPQRQDSDMTRALSTWKRYASMLVIFAIALGLRFQQTRNVCAHA